VIRYPFDITTASTVSFEDKVYPLCTSQLPSPLGDFIINRMRHSVYIDDLNVYGGDPVLKQLISISLQWILFIYQLNHQRLFVQQLMVMNALVCLFMVDRHVYSKVACFTSIYNAFT
jgi:hypothetical protein